jgi:hypothetical protein
LIQQRQYLHNLGTKRGKRNNVEISVVLVSSEQVSVVIKVRSINGVKRVCISLIPSRWGELELLQNNVYGEMPTWSWWNAK